MTAQAQDYTLDFVVGPGQFTRTISAGNNFISGTLPILEAYLLDPFFNQVGATVSLTPNTFVDFTVHLNTLVPATDTIKIYQGLTVFLEGTFTDVPTFSPITPLFRAGLDNFTDTKFAPILEQFGYSDASIDCAGSIVLLFQQTGPNGFGVASGDIGNIIPKPPGAPIPGSLLLLGSGLVGLAGIGMRKKSA